MLHKVTLRIGSALKVNRVHDQGSQSFTYWPSTTCYLVQWDDRALSGPGKPHRHSDSHIAGSVHVSPDIEVTKVRTAPHVVEIVVGTDVVARYMATALGLEDVAL